MQFPRSFLILLLLCLPAMATEIIFDVSNNRKHQISSGSAMPESFVFELGVFAPGFVPSAANVQEWAQKWQPAARAAYYVANNLGGYFSGVASFTANPTPFTQGAQAYVWGMSGSEWILLKHSTWRWPAGSSIGAPALTWTADATATAVIGSVVPSGATFYYRSTLVTGALPPPLPWNEWRKLHFLTPAQLANPAVSGPAADPDADGASNVMEYAAASWPEKATSLLPPDLNPGWVSTPAGQHLSMKLRVDPRAQLTVSGEISQDLAAWNTDPSATVLTMVPGEYTLRAAVASGNLSRQLLRFRVAPQ
jgi:hypothetical protein